MRFVKKGSAPFANRRGCRDCLHLVGYVTLWCSNKEARRKRMTSIPGVIHCTEWDPCERWEDLGWFERTLGRLGVIVFEEEQSEADR